jgi:hypothetical protein
VIKGTRITLDLLDIDVEKRFKVDLADEKGFGLLEYNGVFQRLVMPLG